MVVRSSSVLKVRIIGTELDLVMGNSNETPSVESESMEGDTVKKQTDQRVESEVRKEGERVG